MLRSFVLIPALLSDLMTFHPAWVTRMVSSHDQTGANLDGSFNGTPEQDGYKVLFHGKGEGRITRMWMTANPGQEIQSDWSELWIQIDGKTVYRGGVTDFFQGRGDWQLPLVMDSSRSSGGFTSYVPFPYQQEALVMMKSKEHYFHVSYREGAGSSAGPTAEALRSFLSDRWWEKLPTEPADHTIVGPAVVSGLRVKLPASELRNSTIRVGGARAQEIPLSFFFGYAQVPGRSDETTQEISSALTHVDFEGDDVVLSSRLPIPLQDGEEIRIRGVKQVDAQVSDDRIDGVHLLSRFTERDAPGQPTTMSFFEGSAAINYVGIVESIEGGNNDRYYLEGDEMIRTRGMSYPLYLGTGTEDFYNGGWYFTGPHSNPLSGEPRAYWTPLPAQALYRYFVADPIVSIGSMRFGFEAGETGTYQPAHYRVLSLAYGFDGYDAHRSVAIDANQLVAQGQSEVKSEELTLDGERGQTPQKVRDFWSQGSVQTEVACPRGARWMQVTRGYSSVFAGQSAEVSVNGRSVGALYEAWANPIRSLAEDVLMVGLSSRDCRHGHLLFGLRSATDFSSIQYRFDFY